MPTSSGGRQSVCSGSRFHDPGPPAQKWGVWEEGLGPRAWVCASLAGRQGGPAWLSAQNQNQD